MPRIQYDQIAPGTVKALYGVHAYVEKGKINEHLRTLVTLRVSQVNGCGFCVDMHTQELRKLGETQQRIDCLVAWSETDLYTPREQTAFKFAEAVTLISQTHVPDDIFALARTEFTDEEIVDLAMAVVDINSWNRMAITFRKFPARRDS
ncbi:alkyl hydroperoxide reductase AhpD [Capsulimonas corticalis]|uniref:Alkyl hydroperoxide reductase AhpD n=1 Tax=Capsulimonas corticalis TaxID=2219043 RepID=A0A402CZN4_9BACT|nr:carboxymuconolactone decarboxylase family protein [Capsulimonas corticalis]BDI33896.1 alkyl hydroperoxide reductase AhpD [Capsulimonas corticalis]